MNKLQLRDLKLPGDPQHPSAWAELASLPLCLEAVLRSYGAEVDLAGVAAALEWGAWIKPTTQDCIAEWMLAASDRNLVSAARALGLELRDMHPPDAAVGLTVSAEYPEHFADSYVPLIRRAAANGQVCLARRGWPPAAGPGWGIVVGVEGETPVGLAAGCGASLVAMTGPAVQVYVVEAFQAAAAEAWSGSHVADETRAAAQHCVPADRLTALQAAAPETCAGCGRAAVQCFEQLRRQIWSADQLRIRSG